MPIEKPRFQNHKKYIFRVLGYFLTLKNQVVTFCDIPLPDGDKPDPDAA